MDLPDEYWTQEEYAQRCGGAMDRVYNLHKAEIDAFWEDHANGKPLRFSANGELIYDLPRNEPVK